MRDELLGNGALGIWHSGEWSCIEANVPMYISQRQIA